MPRSNHRHVVRHGNAPGDEYPRHHHNKENKVSATFLIILVSLLFVAVFGGALIGGVVSGDPSNGFFITILAASGIAIGVAAIAGLRYWCQQRADRKERDTVTKDIASRDTRGDIRGAITRTADEDEEAGFYDSRGRYYSSQGPVEEDIEEVEAPTMAPGDVSAMSPGTYDYDTYAETRTQFTRSEYNGNGYRLRVKEKENTEFRPSSFDFESVTSKQSLPMREDPPEDIGCNLYCGMPVSKDPSARIVTADGNMVIEESSDVDINSPMAMSQTSRSVRSRYDVEDDEEAATEDTSDDESGEMRAAIKQEKRERSKSPVNESKHKDAVVPPPPPPRSTKSGRSTPTASEAGSSVSSLFLKPFASMFSKKRTTSEAGYSDSSTNIKGSQTGLNVPVPRNPPKPSKSGSDKYLSGKEGKPPMPGRKNSKTLSTVGVGDGENRYNPATPGKNSTFSIPPPRRVPSTPGSEAPSEFRSMAGSSVFSNGVASSTFDPKAHERALRRTQNNAAALGATFNDMPIYYEDNESAVTSIAPSAALSEPTARSIGYDVFAPPGPIGIVVDTIDKGCIVHSLKKTSPMQGLINPGDLIVALDDFDVRQMDAASLTKLMAKKSQQQERKFTLIPAEEY